MHKKSSPIDNNKGTQPKGWKDKDLDPRVINKPAQEVEHNDEATDGVRDGDHYAEGQRDSEITSGTKG